MTGALKYYEFRDRCVYCDIVEQEMQMGDRVIFETEHILAIAPFASRSPFETWLIPKVHAPSFEASTAVVYRELAQTLKIVLCKLKKALDNPPYNFMLHTSPFGEADLPHYHWHVEILPALTNVAGFEWGSGFYINPTPPERAAQFLRAVEVAA
jgi:UDPglucose--hexose-1-phosphate uridylyltransferase